MTRNGGEEWHPVWWVATGTIVMFLLGVFGVVHEILGPGRSQVLGTSGGLILLALYGVRVLHVLASLRGGRRD